MLVTGVCVVFKFFWYFYVCTYILLYITWNQILLKVTTGHGISHEKCKLDRTLWHKVIVSISYKVFTWHPKCLWSHIWMALRPCCPVLSFFFTRSSLYINEMHSSVKEGPQKIAVCCWKNEILAQCKHELKKSHHVMEPAGKSLRGLLWTCSCSTTSMVANFLTSWVTVGFSNRTMFGVVSCISGWSVNELKVS
jgi:hypothetical protein